MIKIIEKLPEEEKKKLLDLVYDEYYLGGGATRYESPKGEVH
jgi:hypothetical protein